MGISCSRGSRYEEQIVANDTKVETPNQPVIAYNEAAALNVWNKLIDKEDKFFYNICDCLARENTEIALVFGNNSYPDEARLEVLAGVFKSFMHKMHFEWVDGKEKYKQCWQLGARHTTYAKEKNFKPLYWEAFAVQFLKDLDGTQKTITAEDKATPGEIYIYQNYVKDVIKALRDGYRASEASQS